MSDDFSRTPQEREQYRKISVTVSSVLIGLGIAAIIASIILTNVFIYGVTSLAHRAVVSGLNNDGESNITTVLTTLSHQAAEQASNGTLI